MQLHACTCTCGSDENVNVRDDIIQPHHTQTIHTVHKQTGDNQQPHYTMHSTVVTMNTHPH